MRLGLVLLILAFAAFGAVFGALNGERVAFDFYFVSIQLPKGAAMIAALALGWMAGGLAIWLLRVPRLKRELRSARRQLSDSRAKSVEIPRTGTPADGA